MGSHHDLAMQVATDDTVLADFNGSFEHFGVRTTFSRRDGLFFVKTDGPDGELREYPIAYTFGVEPLQQFLVDVGGGRLQALSICWDTRPAADGGQRWFHLYDEQVPHDSELHWTGPFQNWNYMCANCHSTGLQRGYDAAADRFDTTWQEIDVSCEACHGPGSRHVEAARADGGGEGLVTSIRRPAGRWVFADDAPIAHLEGEPRTAQADACARCHARQTPIADYEHGGDLHDAFRISLLEEPLYFADGQILDEVYVYGSFLQSKMHAAGVTCTDCHDPHSGARYQNGNALCTQCHRGTIYDVEDHHHHPLGGPGAACTDCHMTSRTYMGVDVRGDHSFRVPRPDLSVKLGTPNACTSCHGDRDDAWAAATVAGWGFEPTLHFGEALHAGRAWQPDAEALLTRIVDDPAQPAVVRASAVALLARFSSPASWPAVQGALADPDPMVRRGALTALGAQELEAQMHWGGPLLDDPVLSVRMEAAQLLAWAADDSTQLPGLFAALEEYRDTLLWRADRPDSQLNLGNLEAHLGDAAAAERAYRRALEILPSFGAAAVNLADLYRATGREDEGAAVLKRTLEKSPEDGALHHALGLSLIRQQQPAEALAALQRAYELAPNEPRYAYVYGVALNDLGEPGEGLRILEDAVRRFPGNRELASGLLALKAKG